MTIENTQPQSLTVDVTPQHQNFTLTKNTEWQTCGLGRAPKDWRCFASLESVFDKITRGPKILPKDISKEAFNGAIPVYSATEGKKIFGYVAKESVGKVLKAGDLVLCATGTIGFPKMVEEESTSTQNTIQLVAGKERSLGRFAFYAMTMQHEKFFPKKAGTIPMLTIGDVVAKGLIAPRGKSLEETVEFLDFLSNRAKGLESLLAIEEKRRQGLSEELLSGRLRVRKVGERFEVYKNPDDNWQTVEVNGRLVQAPADWCVDKLVNFIPLVKGASIAESATNYEGRGLMYLKTTELWMESTKKKVTSYAESGYTPDQVKTQDEYVISFDGFNKKPGKGTVGLVTCEGEGIVSTSFVKIKKTPYYMFGVNVLRSNMVQSEITKHAEGSIALHSFKHFKNIEAVRPHEEEMVLISELMLVQHRVERDMKKKIKHEKDRSSHLMERCLSGYFCVTT